MSVASAAEALRTMARMAMEHDASLQIRGKPLPVSKPDVKEPWARLSFDHGDTDQASLAGVIGQRKFRSIGSLLIECHCPLGDPDYAYRYAQGFADVYEGKEADGGIWFRNASIRENKDMSGGWFRLDVVVTFEYDRIK